MDYKEILNKINLREQQILEHLAFLRYFDENPVYLHENILKQAVIRYEIRNSEPGNICHNRNSEVLQVCLCLGLGLASFFTSSLPLYCHEILHVQLFILFIIQYSLYKLMIRIIWHPNSRRRQVQTLKCIEWQFHALHIHQLLTLEIWNLIPF